MCLPILFLLIFNCCFVESNQDSCSIVRQQYTEMGLGSAAEVPYSLQPGNICDVSRGCCSQEMEKSFVKKVRRDYIAVHKTYFEHAYQTIKSRSEHFQMSMERYLLHNARIALQSCSLAHSSAATLPHNITADNETLDRHMQAVIDVYSNITHYFKQVDLVKDVNIRRVLRNFVKNTMDIRNVRRLRSITCVNDVADKLEQALHAAWLVKESLKFTRSLIASIRRWEVSEECLFALSRLNYCALCDPNRVYHVVQPCSKFCVNVHKGCLAPVLQISARITEWSRLLQSILLDLQQDISLLSAMSGVNHFIHATLTAEYPEDICGHDLYLFHDPWSDDLLFHLKKHAEELTLFENLFDTLPYQICDKVHYSQPGSENHCWNGTAMSTYNCHIADNGVLAPNPTQVVLGDPLLSEQELRLKEIIRMLYDVTGMTPSPTPMLHLHMDDIRDMCFEPEPREWENNQFDSDEDNVSDKRAHDALSRDQTSDTHPVSPSLLPILLLLLSTLGNNG